MRIYLQALDYEIWEVVCDGPFMPMFKDEVGGDIPKPSSQWSELEKRKMSLNSKAMNALFCALDKKEFHRVSSCESAQEIWNKLEVVYEGTNKVKESKISRYTRQYELFQMEQNENVYSMYTRFTDIVNTLGALGKTFSNREKVKKIIRSLSKEWRPKRTAIEEAKDLNTLPLDDLISSLISYEEDLAAEKGHEEKKKSISLKASKYESDGESEPDDEELAMLARRFRKFFKKTGERRNFRNFKNHREKKEAITCYECKKPGHIRSECPLINKLKKKAMVATWDDSEEESSDEEGSQEVSNLALMAIGGDDDLNKVSDPTYDELYDAFKDLHNELMKIGKKNVCLKKEMAKLKNENESLNARIVCLEVGNTTLHDEIALSNEKPSILHKHLESHIDELKNENEMLKKKSNELNEIVLKFTNGQKILDNMLNSQKCVFDEGGLGYKPNLKQKYYKNYFVKATSTNDHKIGLKKKKNKWYLDSGCSRHMTGNYAWFLSFTKIENGGDISFGDNSKGKILGIENVDGDLQEESSKEIQENAPQENQEDRQEEQTNTELEQQECISQTLPKEWRYVSSHPKDVILGDPLRGVTTRSSLKNTCEHNAFTSQIEPKSFADAENDESWIMAIFQSCPKESHLLAVKRIFRYLSGTIDIGLWYPRGTHIDLTCYSDADFADYKVDKKSTSETMESFLSAIGSPITIYRLAVLIQNFEETPWTLLARRYVYKRLAVLMKFLGGLSGICRLAIITR
ncbi:hypothetical protein KPL71_025892 [Citrus sinensis]|uniref:Uncharacterized protein n=1 Tax=Citrus sinensis TaxID=2711 RepID=A0ACB8HVR6_CITSI|nr:hypothetical protein KPL71_025892 [Citrus sinensis]